MTEKEIDGLMCEAVAEGVFPGGVLLVGKGSRTVFHRAYGLADLIEKRPVTLDTLFDLASLTKPLATALAVMRLAAEGKVDLDAPLSCILPEIRKTDKAEITLRRLLTHVSGYPDYRPYYRDLQKCTSETRIDRLRRLLMQAPLKLPEPGKACYSDLGFMMLRWCVESITRQRLDRFLQKEVYGPLGLKRIFFIDLNAPKKIKGDVAATETCSWRGKTMCGEVHDENAWICGGVEGHAGLFGTSGAVHRLLSALLKAYSGESERTPFRTEWVRAFFQKDMNAGRALGFDMPDERESSAGRFFSPTSVGHLGFTGTSFWVDLEAEVTIILLTNRIHPSRENQRIKLFRPLIHNAVRTWVDRN